MTIDSGNGQKWHERVREGSIWPDPAGKRNCWTGQGHPDGFRAVTRPFSGRIFRFSAWSELFVHRGFLEKCRKATNGIRRRIHVPTGANGGQRVTAQPGGPLVSTGANGLAGAEARAFGLPSCVTCSLVMAPADLPCHPLCTCRP